MADCENHLNTLHKLFRLGYLVISKNPYSQYFFAIIRGSLLRESLVIIGGLIYDAHNIIARLYMADCKNHPNTACF